MQTTTTPEKRDQGFTLIELLVVVLIIGVLAAIAIPVFLSQREKAADAAVKSDLKNMATLQETYFVDEQTYTKVKADLADFKQSNEKDSIEIVNADTAAFCLKGIREGGEGADDTYYYDSDGGGLSQDVCS
ncbi:type IV pilin protein [Nocardioides dongkuii]|uniref:type IV pilin protein n=1 Tax=Nocardioides dongkuii TaxID=2760089 RepID=UPI001C7008F0|nr:prepilin-type N-terminal cleavage/methylation domain-containing protein [Nocardioides dongkuii]